MLTNEGETGLSEQGEASSEQAGDAAGGEQTLEQLVEARVKAREQELVAKARQEALSTAGKQLSELQRRLRETERAAEESRAQLQVLAAETEKITSAYAPEADVPRVKEQVRLQLQASTAEIARQRELRAERDAIIRETLTESGIPMDDPGLMPQTWTTREAFLANVESVKQRRAAEKGTKSTESLESQIKELKAKLAKLTGEEPPDETPAPKGAGVGVTGTPSKGGRDWTVAPDDAYQKEYQRQRRLAGYAS